MSALPSEWIAILRKVRGVYLLTCPETKEQYVGKVSSADSTTETISTVLRGQRAFCAAQC